MTNQETINKLMQFIKERPHINLDKNFKGDIRQEVKDVLKLTERNIINALHPIRKNLGISVRKITDYNGSKEYNRAKDNKFLFRSPIGEDLFDHQLVCRIYDLKKTMSREDIKNTIVVITGTPTLIAICLNNMLFRQRIFTGNYDIIKALSYICGKMYMYIGNLKGRQRVEEKLIDWQLVHELLGGKLRTSSVALTSDTYKTIVSKHAKKQSKKIFVVHLSSGVYKNNSTNHEFNTDYLNASNELFEKFSNLYIWLMIKDQRGATFGLKHFGFEEKEITYPILTFK